MLQRRTPLKRSTKPLKRTQLRRSSPSLKRRKGLNKLSKKNIPVLKRSLRILVNRWIRERDGKCMVFASPAYKPEYGECKGNLEASHLYSELAYPSLRFDPQNILTKCSLHHRWFWHMHPVEGLEWLTGHWTPERFDEWKKNRRSYVEWTPARLTALINILKTSPDSYPDAYQSLINNQKGA